MPRRWFVVAAAALLLASVAHAGAPPAVLPLSETVRRAAAEDSTLQALERRVAALRTAVALIGAPPPMTMRLSAVTGIIPEDANALTQIVELGGQPSARRAAARSVLESAASLRDARQREIAYETARLYLAVLASDAQLALARQDLGAQGALLDIARRRLQAGDAPHSQIVRGEREYARARRDTVAAEQQQAGAREALFTYLGTADRGEALVAPSLTLGEPPGDLDSLVRESLDERPDMRALRADTEERRQQVRLSRAEGAPTLELQAYTTQLQGLQVYGTGAQAGARVTISWALLDWGQRRGQIALAQATVEEAAARLAAAEKDARSQIQEALARWRCRSAARVAAAAESTAAERLVAMLERGYVGGVVVQFEVIEARRSLIEARREALRLQYEETTAALDTWRALGRPLSTEVNPR